MSSNNSCPISIYPIPPLILKQLHNKGYRTTGSVIGLRPSELSTNAEILIEEAADVLEMISNSTGNSIETKTALEMLKEETLNYPISSLSQNIDNLFCGGIHLSKLTEIAGIAGVGKTQLCLQLCIAVQIPKICGGLQSKAIYIDTEGSFNVSRLEDMGEACIKHCQDVMKVTNSDWNLKTIINNIYVYRCKEVVELVSCVSVLQEFIKSHPEVKLIVIDSLAFHFRHDMDNAALRSRVLHKIASQLTSLAVHFQLAVVVTNQMTTKFDSSGEGHLTPALGTSWGHCPSFRLMLGWDSSRAFRWATLIKSSCRPSSSTAYQVTKDGIRDVIITDTLNVKWPRVIFKDGIPGVCF